MTDSSYPQEHPHVVSESQPMNSITLSYGGKKKIKTTSEKEKNKEIDDSLAKEP